MSYKGEFPVNHPFVLLEFNTYDNDQSSPSSAVGFTSADVRIYKNGGTTQRSSASGITVSTDFDGIVGFNLVVIDLSDNDDAGFYEAGAEYSVGIADLTVDSIPARKWIGSFTIGHRWGAKIRQTGVVVTDGGNTASAFQVNLTQTDSDHWKHAFLTFVGGDLDGQTRRISASEPGSPPTVNTITVDDPYTQVPAGDDPFVIVNF